MYFLLPDFCYCDSYVVFLCFMSALPIILMNALPFYLSDICHLALFCKCRMPKWWLCGNDIQISEDLESYTQL